MEGKKYRVGLFGFGRTGKAVASVLACSNDIELCWVARKSEALHGAKIKDLLDLDCECSAEINSLSIRNLEALLQAEPIDILVDFSSREGIYEYAAALKSSGVTLISAISAYDSEEIDLLSELSHDTRVVHSPNITIGVNFLLIASKILRNIAPHADVEIVEEHFSTKPETSGTAKIIAKKLDVSPDQIKSVRAGGIIGIHEVIFGFPNQTVRLIHESIAREAFGSGVLFVIRHLPEERTGFFNMEDLFRNYFEMEAGNGNGRDKARPWWKFWHSEVPRSRYLT